LRERREWEFDRREGSESRNLGLYEEEVN